MLKLKIKKSVYIATSVVLVLALVLTYSGWAYAKVLPSVSGMVTAPTSSPSKAVSIPWPSYGQAALVSPGYGRLGVNGNQTPVPIASIAKVITALTVLKAKPLALNQQGPILTLGDIDVGYYNNYLNNDGSVAKVVSGEQISEYQALQAMLLPSANNMADSLANWAYGSQEAYVAAANSYVSSLGLIDTHVADASGFSPATTSTAIDLITIGEKALDDPVISQIVGQDSATIPVAGTINNVNVLLGTDGMIGIKTGNTDQAGGCFLFAGQKDIAPGQTVKVIGAVLGAPNLNDAMRSSLPLLEASYAGFSYDTLIKSGQKVGEYNSPWGGSADAVAQQDIKILRWNGNELPLTTKLNKIRVPASSGSDVGIISTSLNGSSLSSQVVLSEKVSSPGVFWRVKRW